VLDEESLGSLNGEVKWDSYKSANNANGHREAEDVL